jgi:hypothetical protein
MKTVFGFHLASLAVAGAASLFAVQPVHADTRPLPFHLILGDWHVVPITADGPNGTRIVHSVLALKNKAEVIGENIVSLWYQRDSSGAWSAKAWESSDQWQAIEAVKSDAGIGNQYDDRWPTIDPKLESIVPEAPKGYAQGLLTTDPIFNIIVESPSRPEIVELLAAVGYKAADVPIENQTFACSTDVFLSQLSASIEAAQSKPASDSTASVMNFATEFQSLVGETCAGPQSPTIPPVVNVPWTPGSDWNWDTCPGADYNPATGNCDYRAGHYWWCQWRVAGWVSVPVIRLGIPPTVTWIKVPFFKKCCVVAESWGFSEPSPDGTCTSCPRTAPPNPAPTDEVTCRPYDW